MNTCKTNYFHTRVNNVDVCLPCDKNCLTCNSSATKCTTCRPEEFFLEFKCYTNNCPDKTFSENKNCIKCDSSCDNCVSNSQNCTSCPANTFLFFNSCLPSCPNGYFPSKSGGIDKCLKCDSKCKTCVDTTLKCTSCQST